MPSPKCIRSIFGAYRAVYRRAFRNPESRLQSKLARAFKFSPEAITRFKRYIAYSLAGTYNRDLSVVSEETGTHETRT